MIHFSLRAAVTVATLALSANAALAQISGSDLLVRLDRIEAQMRQLTGAVEQMQFRNQQLEQQLKRMQDDTEYRFQELGNRAAPPPTRAPGPAAPSAPQRRGDAFDPSQTPNAPGVPRTLGAVGSQQANAAPPPVTDAYPQDGVDDEPAVGAPGGRNAGGPLDLGTLSSAASNDPSLVPNAMGTLPRRGPPAGTQVAATQPPSQSPKDEFDLGYGYILRKDYALAEQTMRDFLKHSQGNRSAAALIPDAEYWLGESLFQRQRYRDAAESFLKVSTKHDTSGKAPDALLRLGQSLAALGEKETACAALGEITRKYPRASAGVKQGVEREQKRAKC